jgi:hypothetical protein
VLIFFYFHTVLLVAINLTGKAQLVPTSGTDFYFYVSYNTLKEAAFNTFDVYGIPALIKVGAYKKMVSDVTLTKQVRYNKNRSKHMRLQVCKHHTKHYKTYKTGSYYIPLNIMLLTASVTFV